MGNDPDLLEKVSIQRANETTIAKLGGKVVTVSAGRFLSPHGGLVSVVGLVLHKQAPTRSLLTTKRDVKSPEVLIYVSRKGNIVLLSVHALVTSTIQTTILANRVIAARADVTTTNSGTNRS